MGLLHDIGRRYGITGLKHTIDGYRFLKQQGYDEIARVCLTHSFPIKYLKAFNGNNDCTNYEVEFLESYLKELQYDDYDKLIQLCDSLALSNGICCVKKRLVDVAIRHGFNKYTINKWKSFLELRDYFSNKIDKSIYELFKLIY